nr:PLP-dependent transferase [Aphanizomenon flos-aquae]
MGHFFIWKSLKDNLVRLSVGIEHYLDLQTDLENSLS